VKKWIVVAAVAMSWDLECSGRVIAMQQQHGYMGMECNNKIFSLVVFFFCSPLFGYFS